MDATAWTVVGAAGAILVAIGASFRSLRDEMRAQGKWIDALGEQMSGEPDAPYGESEQYPDTPEHRKYRETYDMRMVVRSVPLLEASR